MKSLTLPIYNLKGESIGTMDLHADVFAVALNPTLMHQAIVAHLANKRAPLAHTKGRGEVRGSNIKPWRQKGTGRARHASTRSPIWRGGGVTFGPRNERNYSVRMPQKMRQGAFKMALSDKVASERLLIIDNLDSLKGKTKDWVTAVATLPQVKGKVLVASAEKSDTADRSIRNIPTHTYVELAGLTLYDIARHGTVILTKDTVEHLTSRLAPTKKPVAA